MATSTSCSVVSGAVSWTRRLRTKSSFSRQLRQRLFAATNVLTKAFSSAGNSPPELRLGFRTLCSSSARPSPSGSLAIELRKSAPKTEAVFSLSSDEGGGEGRGEEHGLIGFPLSPLVPPGEREGKPKVHSPLNSTAVPTGRGSVRD